jgi:cytochrome b561
MLVEELRADVNAPSSISRRPLVSRYQPALVALHWLLALMIIGLLCVGVFARSTPNTNPAKLDILMLHMSGGTAVLLLMIVRFVTRVRSTHPAAATTGFPLLDRLAKVSHYGFYAIILLMYASGFSTELISGLNHIVFERNGHPLPKTFAVYPTFQIHAVLAGLLAVLIAVHISAALYHQFVRKDGLFRRMWFGKRTIVPAGSR